MERSREFYSRIPGTELIAHRPGEFCLFRIGEGAYGALRAAGVKRVGLPRDRPWGERTFEVVDPDGNRLEFQEG